MQISIIGAGNMASGIAARALAGGHRVRLTDRDPAKAKTLAEDLRERVPGADVAAQDAAVLGGTDIVVLALPFAAAEEIAAAHREQLAGKTVVDISNPVDFGTFDSLVVPPGTSAAEQIAAAAPGAHVVKAFNTTFAGNLVAGEAGDPRYQLVQRDQDPRLTSVRSRFSFSNRGAPPATHCMARPMRSSGKSC